MVRRPSIAIAWGAAIALGVILLLEASALVAPRLASPPPILTVPVVIAAYLGATRAGLTCAALLFAYAVLAWGFLAEDPASTRETSVRLVALGVGLPLAGALVGYLREKADRRYKALKDSETRLRQALEFNDRIMAQSLDLICTINAAGEFTMASAASKRILGYRPDELIGRKFMTLVHPDDHERTAAAAARIMTGEHTLNFINRYITQDGRVLHMMWSSFWSEKDGLNYCVARDYTEQKQLDDERSRFMAIIEATTDLVGITWSDGRLSYINQSGREMLGLAPDAPLEGIRIDQIFADGADSTVISEGMKVALERGVWSGESTLKPRLGEPIPVSQIVLSHRKAEGQVEFVSTIAKNISTIKTLEARLREEASTDELSGLSNRRHFMERFRAAMQSARRRGHPLSFAFIDLDKFKSINDLHGHAVGDDVIRAVARMLAEETRGDDLACRYGGDEFCAMFPFVTSGDAALVLERIRRRVETLDIRIGAKAVSLSISAGIAEMKDMAGAAETPEQLMALADQALYAAKLAGRNRVQVAAAERP